MRRRRSRMGERPDVLPPGAGMGCCLELVTVPFILTRAVRLGCIRCLDRVDGGGVQTLRPCIPYRSLSS